MTWNANRTITYRQKRWWYFDQENSNGTLDDVVTTLNVVTLVCLLLNLLHHGISWQRTSLYHATSKQRDFFHRLKNTYAIL